MLGYQTQTQGSTAGLSLYGSRDFPYSMPVQHLLHNNSDAVRWNDASATINTRDISSWTSSLKQRADSRRMAKKPERANMATAMAEPSDLSRLVDIEFAAFREETINHHLSYRDSTDSSHINRTLRTYRKYMNNLRTVPEDAAKTARPTAALRHRADSAHDQSLGFRFRKVESPEGGEIIAFCKSEMAELTQDEILSPLDAGHEGEPQMNRDWFALNELYHRQYCGQRKHCYFGMLATHPDHQHQGAATMLMDELISEADRLGVEIYCEATRTGRPLYEKYGFVVVKEINFATAAYGTDIGEEHQDVMVRGALGPDGKRRPVRSWDEAIAESSMSASF